MRNEIVDRTGAANLLLMMLTAKLFTSYPRMLAVVAGNGAWLVVFLSGVVAFLGFLPLSALLRRFPQQSLGQISLRVLGPKVGGLFCLTYTCFFVFLAGAVMRQFEASFRIAILPRTPASVLMMTFSLAVVYLVYKGFETICRMSAYFLPVLLVLLALLFLGTLRLADFRYLLPLFGNGVEIVLLHPFPGSSMYGEILALGALAGMLRRPDTAAAGTRAFWGSLLLMTGSMILLAGIFPHPTLSRLHSPMLELARSVQAGEFLQRVEAIFVLLWFFLGSFQVAAALACAAAFFRDMARLTDYRPLAFALALIASTIAFLPANTVEAGELAFLLRSWSWPVTYFMPAITLGVAVWQARREAQGDAVSG